MPAAPKELNMMSTHKKGRTWQNLINVSAHRDEMAVFKLLSLHFWAAGYHISVSTHYSMLSISASCARHTMSVPPAAKKLRAHAWRFGEQLIFGNAGTIAAIKEQMEALKSALAPAEGPPLKPDELNGDVTHHNYVVSGLR